MPERKKERRDDSEEREKGPLFPFGEEVDEDTIGDIDDIIEETGEEVVEKRKDKEGE